jgi:hypothetical protein
MPNGTVGHGASFTLRMQSGLCDNIANKGGTARPFSSLLGEGGFLFCVPIAARIYRHSEAESREKIAICFCHEHMIMPSLYG